MLRSSLPSLLFLGSIVSAQEVWTVGPPASGADFTSLQTAADTVADGDVLLLRTGSYASLVLAGKGLTVVADAGAAPSIGSATVSALPGGKSVRLQGLTIASGIDLGDCTGTVWIEDCVVNGPYPYAIEVRQCASVALLEVRATGFDGAGDCAELENPGGGMLVSSSGVHVYGGAFTGGDGGTRLCASALCVTDEGAEGVVVGIGPPSVLLLSGTRVQGGGCSGYDYAFCDGVCMGYPPLGSIPGVGCAGSGLLDGGGAAHVLDSLLSGGAGYWCDSNDDLPGKAYSGPVDFLPGSALRMTPLEPVREGTTVPIRVEGPPHSLVRVGSSDRTWTLPAFELVRGTSLLRPSSAATVRTLGVTNASGVLDTTIDVGPLAPGAEVETTFFQVYYVKPERPKLRRFGEPLADVVLGQATMLVVLDESL